MTSRWYADSLPSWVRAFNDEDRVRKRYAGAVWMPLLPEASYPEPDTSRAEAATGEADFPHIMPDDSTRARAAIAGFPWMDDLTLDLAWRGVRAMDLGAGPATDLLAVSLSTTDAIGHRWGPDSRELHDQILRLDRTLGAFLDSLVALRGAGNVVVALTADHGVAPSPDVRSTWGNNQGADRVYRDDFETAMRAVTPLLQRYQLAPDAFMFDGHTLEVDRAKLAGRQRETLLVLRAFAAEAKKVPGVLRVDVIDDLARADTVKDAIARRWLHMFRPGGEVGAAITLKPYFYFGRGNTATHGSPHDYDARVPIIFWGAPFAPGRIRDARVVDIAPTLADMMGVRPLEKLDGVVLRQVFRPPSR